MLSELDASKGQPKDIRMGSPAFLQHVYAMCRGAHCFLGTAVFGPQTVKIVFLWSSC